MISLKNKIVLVTGGSRGIGRACVELFLTAGADISFTYKSGKKEAEEIVSKYKGTSKLKSYKTDISLQKEIENTVKNILNDFGRIDVLVNNAGIWKEAAIENMSKEEWDEMMNINLTSSFLFTKYVVPGMKQNKSGKIINISSTAGQRGESFHSHYAASKGAIISFTKSLAPELGEFNITVNCVAPGWVVTDMTQEALSDNETNINIQNDIPLKKIAKPEEIAGPVIFLASDLASHITGEILNVNGGSVLCG